MYKLDLSGRETQLEVGLFKYAKSLTAFNSDYSVMTHHLPGIAIIITEKQSVREFSSYFFAIF